MKHTRCVWSLIVLASAILVVGCSVGPDYKKPKIELSPEYRSPTTRATSTRPTEVTWWRTFNDPILDELIYQGSRDSLDVAAAAARVRQARELRNAAGAGFWPTANATASYQRTRSGGGGFTSTGAGGGIISTSGGGSERDLYQAGFDANWELDVFGGVRRDVEATGAQFQQAIANYQNILITLYGEIARNYIDLRGFQREIAIAEDNSRAQRETLELVRTKFRAGLTSDLDVARAEAQVATTESDIPLLQTQASAAAHRLSVLTGKEPTALLDDLSHPVRMPDPPPQVPVGIPSELLRRRPDIRAAERNLAAQTALIGVNVADLYPRFTLTGDVGWRASNISSLFNNGNLFWGAGPGVSWNIFSAGRTRANIRAQRARVDEAIASYKLTILTALEEVQNALVAYQNDTARTRELAASVASNTRAVSLAQQLYQRGLADFLNVLQAQLNLFTAQDQLVRSYTNTTNDAVSLYKALGGGWEKMPEPSTRTANVPATQPIPWVTPDEKVPTTQPLTAPADVLAPAPRPSVQSTTTRP